MKLVQKFSENVTYLLLLYLNLSYLKNNRHNYKQINIIKIKNWIGITQKY